MLRRHFINAILCALFIVAPQLVHAGTPGVVTAKKLNVRIRPTTKYSITGTLSKGDKVNILKREGDWYMISAPQNSSVWLSRPFIDGDTITKRVNLRCGPSVAFMKYTAVNPGMKVVVLDNSRDDWVKIAPPRGLATYVSAQFVSVIVPKPAPKPVVAAKPEPATPVKKPKPAKVAKKPEVKPAETPRTSVATATPATTPTKPEDKNFQNMSVDEIIEYIKEKNSSVSQTKSTESDVSYVEQVAKNDGFEGILKKVTSNPLATHCVALLIHGEYVKLCYVHTERYNLDLWENRKISVKGRLRWVKDWTIPVIEADRIRPLWD